jgi:hypothetical protein
LNDESFQKVLAGTGFDPRRDLKELVAMSDGAATRSHGLILARGNFDAARINAYVQQQHSTPTERRRGVTMLLPPAGGPQHRALAFAVLDKTTAVLGDPDLVRQAIDHKHGKGAVLPPGLARQVSQWSATNHAWIVSAVPLAELGAGKPGREALLPGGIAPEAIQSANAGVRFGALIEMNGELTARSDKDAESLGDVLRFLRSMLQMHTKKAEKNELAELAGSMKIANEGSLVRFSLAVPEEQADRFFNANGRHQARTEAAPARP